MASKDSRYRNWAFFVYPDSAPQNWRDIIDSRHAPWVESPLHDKDVNPDGETKKPHWHVIICFENKQSFESVKLLTDELNQPHPQYVENLRGYVRYLSHMDNPEKAQYNPADVVPHCGFDIGAAYEPTSSQRSALMRQICQFIRAERITEYAVLMDALLDFEDSTLWNVAQSQTIFFTAYIRSIRHGGYSEPPSDDKK